MGDTRVIKPQSVEELQKVVTEAAKTGEKLTPVSSSAPHGSAAVPGASTVDLSGWKKISHIDPRNRVCMIEPGVTYSELLAALKPHGLTLSMPLAPRPGKSVLAAVLDREPSTWPNKQWDSMDPLASMEVVFGDGSLFRTGAAGGPGTLEKQRESGGAQKSPMGPSQTDFQRLIGGAQGTMGIATWITLRCELLPALEEPRLVGSDDLNQLIDFIYAVEKAELGEHCFIMDRAGISLLAGGNGDSLPAFVALINVCGFQRLAAERVEYQLLDLADLATKHQLSLEKKIGNVTAAQVLAAALKPDCDVRPGRSRLFFLSTLDKAPGFIKIFSDRVKGEFETYLQPVVQNHACHVEFLVPRDKLTPEIEKDLVLSLSAADAYFNRPYGAAVDVVTNKNPLEADMQRKIKKVFDPAGILSPGRLGL